MANIGDGYTIVSGTGTGGTLGAFRMYKDGVDYAPAVAGHHTWDVAGSFFLRQFDSTGNVHADSGTVVVSSAVALQTLTLSGALQIGVATSGSIIGASAGSTIVGNIPGITVNSGARTYSGTPTGSAGVISNGLVETLAGAVGSPKSSAISVMAAAPGITAPVISQTSSAGVNPLLWTTAENATFFPGFFWNVQTATGANTTVAQANLLAGTTTANIIQQIEPGDLAGNVVTFAGLTTTSTPGPIALRERVGSDDGMGGYIWGPYSNVIADTIVAQANPFTFTDVTNATQSTVYTSNTITISGLGVGNTNAYSVSGGTVSKNGGSFTSSSGTVVDGDTLAVRVTSSASLATAVNVTLTVGTYADTYTVTTVAVVAPAIYRSSAATNNNATPFSGLTTISGLRHIVMIEASNALALPGAVSLDGNAMTMRGAGTIASNKSISIWDVVIASGGTGKSLAVTMTTTADTAYAMWTMASSAVYVTQQVKAYGYTSDPQTTASVTIPSGGAVLVGCISESGGASITPNAGTTEEAEFTEATANYRHWYGQLTATGTPSVSGLNFAGSAMLAASYG
ncbi:hypothetical protein FPZ24_08165 [Sphingomonas panacisoli]|uniref:Uncharacterized protein n=1 Tax=Sphingomonas panacisoli TaxID=1813879 RepID=A0A5B8LGU8_9SPHN|nr:hypothetical protein [Sphingomonas panacisoli]QDZ07457.1 hypothetical protein FPZ24_08165 [Sphingomonas panacisoli]